jgi:aromatic-L-amino-acid decarboxylase
MTPDKEPTGPISAGDPDAACRTDLAAWLGRLLPELEAFSRFSGPDGAGRNRERWMAALNQSLPEEGEGMEAVIREITETIIPNGLRIGAPGFCGWVTTSPTVAGTAAGLAGMVAGSQRVWIHPCNFLETLALQWLGSLLGIPADRQGIFVGGGSVANIVGLAAARQWALEQRSHDPARDGLPAEVPLRVYASSEVHHVVTRAAAVLGLGRRGVIQAPVDEQHRIRIDSLRGILEQDARSGIVPVALVATAGTVNTGAVDPIADLAELAREYATWLHVDGAYGLFGILDPRVAPLYAGLERADSAAVDPHKWLAAPVGCGAAFVRDRSLLGRALTLEPAEYLEGSAVDGPVQSAFDNFGDVFHDFGLDQSAPSRGIQVWAILKEIGARGIRERIIRHHDFARRVADRAICDPRLELVAPPVLSICCFRYRPPEWPEARVDDLNQALAARLRAESPYVPSTTVVRGKLVIRPCFINPRTEWRDVDGLMDAVLAIGDQLARR